MANIKDIYENSERTTKFYPRTHEKAVVDDNGTPLNNKLGIINNLINQKQYSVGATQSDNEPTEESAKYVTSGGLYNELRIDSDINLSNYATKECSMGATNWYTAGAAGRHKAIPVTVGEKYHLQSYTVNQTYGAYYGWLTSSYTGSATNNTPIPYVSGTGRIMATDAILTVPEGAAYLCLTIVDGNGDSVENTLAKVVSLKKIISLADATPTSGSENLVKSGGVYDELQKKIDKLNVLQTYSLSDYTEKDCSLGTSTWYKNGTSGRHKAFAVTAGHYYQVNGSGFTGWMTSSYTGNYSNRDTIPYVAGTSRMWNVKGDIIKAPVGAAYLCIVTVDGSGNPTTITEVYDVKPIYEEFVGTSEAMGTIDDTYTIVDLASYTQIYGILSSSGAQWYKYSGYYHIAIPVVAGEEYIIKSGNWWYYGLLQSYSGTDSNPVYSAYSTSRVGKPAGTYKIIIPSDCTYMVINAKSGGTNVLPQLMCKLKVLPWVLDQMMLSSVEQTKFTFAHWNIGHFSYYDKHNGGSDTTISGEDSGAMALRYKTMINKVSPDIFGICEYNPEFDLDGGLAKDLVFQNYKYQFIGTKNGYQCQTVFSNFKGVDGGEVSYTSHTQTTGYHYTLITISGVQTYVVETHLDWTSAEMRASQINQLLTAFSSYGHVIIGGDFNVATMSEYQPFVSAGYTMANGGYIGNVPTYLKDNGCIDNIMVKGFAMSNIKAWDESGWSEGGLSDHSCISCDLVLLP